MTPGRELDALVAEKMLGWARLPERTWKEPNGAIRYEPRHFSEDIAAAWEVAARFKYYRLYCREFSDDDRRMIHVAELTSTERNSDEWGTSYSKATAYAEGAAHAICLAALRAVGVEVGA